MTIKLYLIKDAEDLRMARVYLNLGGGTSACGGEKKNLPIWPGADPPLPIHPTTSAHGFSFFSLCRKIDLRLASTKWRKMVQGSVVGG